ncbi:hypothetical protein BpHYR1_013678 [Brachionus plicatilis]|uniref:Uncharacterized protein n=1 Tax=Brachionus plicatilis TaxID=10195 RepID=A0A3M7SXY3_BRAPC|nr:hypothetical protein BpHYR1_013678 [Brachionus plicatilis]
MYFSMKVGPLIIVGSNFSDCRSKVPQSTAGLETRELALKGDNSKSIKLLIHTTVYKNNIYVNQLILMFKTLLNNLTFKV